MKIKLLTLIFLAACNGAQMQAEIQPDPDPAPAETNMDNGEDLKTDSKPTGYINSMWAKPCNADNECGGLKCEFVEGELNALGQVATYCL